MNHNLIRRFICSICVLVTAVCLIQPAQAASPIQIIAVGDIMLGRSIEENVLKSGDVNYPFERMLPLMQDADLLIGNLECLISDKGEARFKAYSFRVGLWGIDSLKNAGFDLLNLANNHAYDYGPEALLDTRARLRWAGIAVVGAGKDQVEAHDPAIIERNGIKIAFLGYVNTPVEIYGFDTFTAKATATTAGIAWGEPETITAEVQAAKQKADLVIVMLHSGVEGRIEPSAIQMQLARAAIDAGATAVIGSHPHIQQGIEFYNGGLIAYSLGNFVFEMDDIGQAFLRLWIDKDGVRDYAWEPYRVAFNGRPIPTAPNDSQAILSGIESMTKRLNGQ
ncbi:MAG: CapA family protein [Anaerolineae bacterium]|nr:CapA family protein [Anaerolineae bacterium]